MATPTSGKKPSTRHVTKSWQTPDTPATLAVARFTDPMDPSLEHHVANDRLVASDPRLAAVVERQGRPAVFRRPASFATLVLLILEQQVSLSSAAAAYRRLAEMTPVEPAPVLELDDATLRAIGFSRQKMGYVRALATAEVSGDIDIDGLAHLADDEARASLLALPGIGPWTADVFLLSSLGRPDIWPTGDRALQVGAAEVLGLSGPPSAVELEAIGQPWRPLRSTAAQLIWHEYLARRGRPT